MKKFFLAAALLLAFPAIAQTGDSAKYARCAGSSEAQKCRALVDSMAAETPEAKNARIKKLEQERLSAAREVEKQPLTYKPSAQRALVTQPSVGMSEYEAADTQWGRPESINRTVTASGKREQWVYGSGRYVYLENGRVTAISSRH